jgi:hypothetical protein
MALPQGGHFTSDFPIPDTLYMEGIIKQCWEIKKVKESSLKDFPQVSTFVSYIYLKSL